MITQDVWQKCLEQVRMDVGEGVFERWFDPIRLVGSDTDDITIEIPNRFFKEWIEDYHPTLLGDVLERLTTKRYAVKYKIAVKDDAVAVKEDAKLESRKSRLARRGIFLNPRFTFESFIVGASNQFAHAAALKVSEEPGRVYNPLFVYGGVGLGKTHLITAIGNRIVDLKRNFNVLFTSTEQFASEVISAIRHTRMDELKKKYRSLDMLIIDDIQFIENKAATQEELFHTLNTLYNEQKQIVISSDRSPREIKEVTDRLRSRFGMGLIADIQPPDLETKIAIMQKKAEADRIMLPADVISYLANRIRGNIRDMESCLIRLGAHSSITGAPITLDVTKQVLHDMIQDDDKPVNIEKVAKLVAEHYGIKMADMRARKRTREVAMPRQVAMYLSRELTDSSLGEIGKQLGGKNHATVIYAVKRIMEKRAADESFGRMLDSLIAKLKP